MIRHISTSGMPGKEFSWRSKRLGFCVEVFRRALALVTEWAALHQTELMEDWALAREEAQLKPIAPLE